MLEMRNDQADALLQTSLEVNDQLDYLKKVRKRLTYVGIFDFLEEQLKLREDYNVLTSNEGKKKQPQMMQSPGWSNHRKEEVEHFDEVEMKK